MHAQIILKILEQRILIRCIFNKFHHTEFKRVDRSEFLALHRMYKFNISIMHKKLISSNVNRTSFARWGTLDWISPSEQSLQLCTVFHWKWIRSAQPCPRQLMDLFVRIRLIWVLSRLNDMIIQHQKDCINFIQIIPLPGNVDQTNHFDFVCRI